MQVPNKTARLTKVVERCGRPEAVTLWVSPRKDPRFRTALEQNRVLTVKQETVGSRKDFGLVGFHQEPNVAYWLFPKKLDAFKGKKIVGIDYALLSPPKVTGPLAKSTPAKRPRQPPVPVFAEPPPKAAPLKPEPSPLRNFRVTVRYTSTVEVPQDIQAKTQREAKTQAMSAPPPSSAEFEKGVQQRKVLRIKEMS
jgi:hypothetical protein